MFGVLMRKWRPKRTSNSDRNDSPGTDSSVSPEPPDRPPGKAKIHPEENTQILAYDSSYRRKPKTLELEENNYNHLANSNVATTPLYPLTPNICMEGGKIEFIKSPIDGGRNSLAFATPPQTPLLSARGLCCDKQEETLYEEAMEKCDEDKEIFERRIKQLELQLEEERRQTQRERMAVTKLQNKLLKSSLQSIIMTIVQKPNSCRARSFGARMAKCGKSACSKKTLKKRLPITHWLPYYSFSKLIQDIIAGTTVALTAIPQGIAYSVVIGLPPEYGLYGGIMGGFVYLIFGGSKDITVGPTAVVSAMTAKYVMGRSADFAVLAAFLSGIVELAMGVLQLGFVVDFISGPVVNGFTTSAAFQIAAGQLKALLGLQGSAGHIFSESMFNFTKNVKTASLWDSILGVSTIVTLFALKYLGQGCTRDGNCGQKLRWFVSLARNAIVVIVGMIIAYILNVATDSEPLTLIGDIGGGLPSFSPPPFSTTVGNETYTFVDMINVYGVQSIVLPLVAILESVAVAKAFAGGTKLDATQEMIALGLCNIIGSFVRSMPVTGSFTRTALNNASGVQTQAGGIFTGLIIILALSLLTSTFYFIPKASLAGLIITAMYSMVHFNVFVNLWRNSKRELFVLLLTMAVSLTVGLEFGIMAGTIAEAAILLYRTSRPRVQAKTVKTDSTELAVIPLNDRIAYCAAEHVRGSILKGALKNCIGNVIIVDGTDLRGMDTTVAANLMSGIKDLENRQINVIFMNFRRELQKMCTDLSPLSKDKFITAINFDDCIAKAGVKLNVEC